MKEPEERKESAEKAPDFSQECNRLGLMFEFAMAIRSANTIG